MAYELFESMSECSKSNKEIIIERLIDDIKLDFENNVNYYEVNKNMDYDTSYKVIINDLNTFKKNPWNKKLILYPYDDSPTLVEQGDYINWNVNGSLSDWLIVAIDNQYYYNVRATITKATDVLKWIDDDGNTKSYPCVFISIQSDSDADISSSKYLELISKDRTVLVQKNDDTETIFDGKRFLFGKSAFKVGHVDDYSVEGLIQIFLEQDQSNDETDNFTDGIADYYDRAQYSIEIINGSVLEIVSGGTVQLDYQLLKNGEVSTESVVWSSDDESIATIDEDGLVTLIQDGVVNISVAMEDNSDIDDSIEITITATPSDNKIIEVTPDLDVLRTNESETFSIVTKNNGSIIASAYTITVDASSTGTYDVDIDSTSYTITNNSGTGNVVINITDTVNSISTQKTYELKGLW